MEKGAARLLSWALDPEPHTVPTAKALTRLGARLLRQDGEPAPARSRGRGVLATVNFPAAKAIDPFGLYLQPTLTPNSCLARRHV